VHGTPSHVNEKHAGERKSHLARTSPAASGFGHGTPSHLKEKHAKSRGTPHTGGRERTRFTNWKGEVNIARELRRLLQMVVIEEEKSRKDERMFSGRRDQERVRAVEGWGEKI
jgi:hypothetical protein